MANWLVKLVNMNHPFDVKEVVVTAPTIVEAFDEKNHGLSQYWPRSAQYHPVVSTDQLQEA